MVANHDARRQSLRRHETTEHAASHFGRPRKRLSRHGPKPTAIKRSPLARSALTQATVRRINSSARTAGTTDTATRSERGWTLPLALAAAHRRFDQTQHAALADVIPDLSIIKQARAVHASPRDGAAPTIEARNQRLVHIPDLSSAKQAACARQPRVPRGAALPSALAARTRINPDERDGVRASARRSLRGRTVRAHVGYDEPTRSR